VACETTSTARRARPRLNPSSLAPANDTGLQRPTMLTNRSVDHWIISTPPDHRTMAQLLRLAAVVPAVVALTLQLFGQIRWRAWESAGRRCVSISCPTKKPCSLFLYRLGNASTSAGWAASRLRTDRRVIAAGSAVSHQTAWRPRSLGGTTLPPAARQKIPLADLPLRAVVDRLAPFASCAGLSRNS